MVLKIKTGPLAAVTWVLIFGGMLMLALGLVVRRTEVELGSWIAGLSIAAIVVGVVLVWVRSRIGEAKP
jgi:hypothetical protein